VRRRQSGWRSETELEVGSEKGETVKVLEVLEGNQLGATVIRPWTGGAFSEAIE
jgi:hypothetical protein